MTAVLPVDDHQPAVESGLARLPSLTGLRWWAALFVVFFHSLIGILGGSYFQLHALHTWALGGFLGVSLFFVLSGFVLTWAWNPAEPKSQFYLRRFARVYPLYALSILAFWIFVVKVLHQTVHWKAAFASLALVQAHIPYERYFGSPSFVAWSLSCEALFYALLPFVLPRLWRATQRSLLVVVAVVAAWIIMVPVVLVATIHDFHLVHGLELNPFYRFGEFMLGVCVALLMRRGWRLPVGPWVVSAVLVGGYFVASSSLRILGHHGWSVEAARFAAIVIFLPCVAIGIAGLAGADLSNRRTPVSDRISVRLGEWSYAMYLIHVIVLFYVAKFLKDHGAATRDVGVLTSILRLALLVAALVVISWLLHSLIELPLNRAIRRAGARKLARETKP